jgi:hypothetical protein
MNCRFKNSIKKTENDLFVRILNLVRILINIQRIRSTNVLSPYRLMHVTDISFSFFKFHFIGFCYFILLTYVSTTCFFILMVNACLCSRIKGYLVSQHQVFLKHGSCTYIEINSNP